MKRPNGARMQRHAARSTPDHITTTMDFTDLDSTGLYEIWVRQFGKRMEIKHGPRYRGVDVETHNDFGRGEVFFSATVRLDQPRLEKGLIDLYEENLMTPEQARRVMLWNNYGA